MKIKNIIVPGLLLLTSVGMSSCEDFLDKVNPNEVTSSSYYASIADCESSLAAVYNSFKNMGCYHPVEELMRSDLAIQGSYKTMKVGRKANTYDDKCHIQTFDNTHAAASDKWKSLYRGIFRANQLIDGLNKYAASTTLRDDAAKTWSTIMGEARFFRGLFHYWLYISFNHGNVPIVNTVPDGTEASLYKALPEGGAAAVREFFTADFKAALEYNLMDEWEANKKGRVTRGTVNAYLGQSYLYEGEYAEAEKYFDEVIKSGVYSLAAAGMNTSAVHDHNSESIFEVNYTEAFNSDMSGLDKQMTNTWHTNFSINGQNVYRTVFPAGWYVRLLQEEDTVDPANPMNWYEVETDELGNIRYRFDGVDCDKSTTNANTGITTKLSYVYKKYSEEEVAKFGTLYSRGVQERKQTFDAEGNTNIDEDQYATSFYLLDKAPVIKEENGKVYRLRQFTRRGSAQIMTTNNMEDHYYGGLCQKLSKAPGFAGHALGAYCELTNHDLYNNEDETMTIQRSGANLRLMTLSDVYLMYAECRVKAGDTQTALDYMNKLRHRGGATLLGAEGEFAGVGTYDGKSYDPDAIMNLLMYVDRPIEVGVGQGTRVCDLRRWGITHDRFKELSQNIYHYGPAYCLYPAKDLPNNGLTKKTLFTTRLYLPEDITYMLSNYASWIGFIKDVTDFSLAAQNYTDEENAYWPIPNDEILANPNFN